LRQIETTDERPTCGRKAKGKRQKPKGKSSRGNIEVEIASASQTFYFCLLPFALRRSRLFICGFFSVLEN